MENNLVDQIEIIVCENIKKCDIKKHYIHFFDNKYGKNKWNLLASNSKIINQWYRTVVLIELNDSKQNIPVIFDTPNPNT